MQSSFAIIFAVFVSQVSGGGDDVCTQFVISSNEQYRTFMININQTVASCPNQTDTVRVNIQESAIISYNNCTSEALTVFRTFEDELSYSLGLTIQQLQEAIAAEGPHKRPISCIEAIHSQAGEYLSKILKEFEVELASSGEISP